MAPGRITIQAVISGAPSEAGTVAAPTNGLMPIASPPPTAALATIKVRSEILGASAIVASLRFRRHVDSFAHLLEAPAAADVGDRGVDFGVGRMWFPVPQRGGRC